MEEDDEKDQPSQIHIAAEEREDDGVGLAREGDKHQGQVGGDVEGPPLLVRKPLLAPLLAEAMANGEVVD